MKKSIALETILFACMLTSTIIIMISMVERDVELCLVAFYTFILSAIALILFLKK
jgi:hypothetical protein